MQILPNYCQAIQNQPSGCCHRFWNYTGINCSKWKTVVGAARCEVISTTPIAVFSMHSLFSMSTWTQRGTQLLLAHSPSSLPLAVVSLPWVLAINPLAPPHATLVPVFSAHKCAMTSPVSLSALQTGSHLPWTGDAFGRAHCRIKAVAEPHHSLLSWAPIWSLYGYLHHQK